MTQRSTQSANSEATADPAAFIEHRVTRNGHSLYAREYPGPGPTFVLMHGFPDNLRIYATLMDSMTMTSARSRRRLTKTPGCTTSTPRASSISIQTPTTLRSGLRRPSWGVVGRFISATQVGDAASVQLSWDREKSSGWIDFHNLLRINGVWKITNKTAAHSSR